MSRHEDSGARRRLRDIGITIGRLPTGEHNAITDVRGVRVGHTTLISGEGPLVVGEGPVRTGVTVILPHEGDVGLDPVFAGSHTFNGNGEMTGLHWVKESGMLTTPIAITNTHSVGVVHDAMISYEVKRLRRPEIYFSLPVVAETFDGWLNDINGMHVREEHVWNALDAASDGPVAEGCVGGGTGMNCHEFKGGIGTSSRVVAEEDGGWTVGVLVQANYGSRHLFRVDGVPVGELIPYDEVPGFAEARKRTGDGSIIIIVATDAPLLPHQCDRLAQRATVGLARVGGIGANSSGDIFFCFANGNRGLPGAEERTRQVSDCRMISPDAMTPLFEACAEATEEAILNAMCMATTTTGINGRTIHALPLARLRQLCCS
jgi:D-aminopeptidase